MEPLLDYASSTVKPVFAVRFRPLATLLIFADLLAAMAGGFFGLIYVDRLGDASAWLIAAAIITAIAILRFLTIQQPRFGIAAIFLLLATIAAIPAWVKTNAAYIAQRNQILKGATGPVVVVYIENENGARLATFELTRAITLAFAAISAGLLLYVTGRYLMLRRRDPIDSGK